MSIVRYWNELSLRLVADDHTGNPIPANQGGPTRTSRALAMIHLAMHDAVALTGGNFPPYLKDKIPVTLPVSRHVVVSYAASEIVRALYPSHSTTLEVALQGAMLGFPAPGPEMTNGEKLGKDIAAALLKLRANDGSEVVKPYQYLPDPGAHRSDPFSPGQQALGPEWGDVLPFTYPQGNHPPVKAPPKLTDKEYVVAYDEVIVEGRDDLPRRDPEKAMKGVFWGYDGAQKLGTPPRLYNQVAHAVVEQLDLNEVDEARLYALINVGMADAGIACWHHKYQCNFWRPVVAIREGGEGAGPRRRGDTNPSTAGDPFWAPLGAPDTNGNRPRNFTPGFPAYPSGHSTFGATCFLLLAEFLGKKPENIKFRFVSDEFNGVNRDSTNAIRPLLEREFTLASAIEENAQSRVWLGVHWSFDATEGVQLARDLVPLVYKAMTSPKITAEKGAAVSVKKAAPAVPARRDPFR